MQSTPTSTEYPEMYWVKDERPLTIFLVASITNSPLRLRIRKKRYLPNSKADTIAAFLRELASRWEMQPDSCEIHIALPTKRVSQVGEHATILLAVDTKKTNLIDSGLRDRSV